MSTITKRNVLIVGDGDLSYSLAVAKENAAINSINLVATTYDCSQQLLVKYKYIGKIIDELHDHNVETYHAVDATDLTQTLPFTGEEQKQFDKIIWNFPHSGGKNFIKKNRLLLRNFFQSASELLRNDYNSTIEVTLCCGQGGTDYEQLYVPIQEQKSMKQLVKRKYADHWQAVEQAADANFMLTDISFFTPPETYQPKGYRNSLFSSCLGFRTNFSVTHIFSRSSLLNEMNCHESQNIPEIEQLFIEAQAKLQSNWKKFAENLNGERALTGDRDVEGKQFNEISFPFSSESKPIGIHYHYVTFEFSHEGEFTELQQQIEQWIAEDWLLLSGYTQCEISFKWEEENNYRKCYILLPLSSIEYPETEPPHKFLFCSLNTPNDGKSGRLKIQFAVEEVLMSLFRVNDARWFISRDNRSVTQLFSLWNQFQQQLHHDGAVTLKFRPISLFSPTFVFDISFWLPKGVSELTAEKLHDAVQLWSSRIVIKQWKFFEKYISKEEEPRISETHKITYQKLDGALSRQSAKMYHQQLEKFLHEQLGVTLR